MGDEAERCFRRPLPPPPRSRLCDDTIGDEAGRCFRRPLPPPPRSSLGNDTMGDEAERIAPPPPELIAEDAHWGNCSPAFRTKAEGLLWTLREGDGWVVLTAEMVEAYPASPLAHCIVAHVYCRPRAFI
ncbi:hypothetical protein E2562_014275 [Oryza meyeriana var. granulata]|uniref:Uncharacterized protein n=1 Tax=Oryza meyeriana var. granulata TaxID=110450 RepID=A0A6G1C661_9ORYZ|nr:hypothetical protein E2562_014275 [Oryza meyeriana var. granulata]